MYESTGTPHRPGSARSARLAAANALTDDCALPVGAYTTAIAPNSSGCISDISSDSIHGCEHAYAAAMKTYGTLYEQYQSYLMPRNQLLAHDYDVAAKPVPAFSHLGCLNADLLESTVHADSVSDDEIETCGYLGWLHH